MIELKEETLTSNVVDVYADLPPTERPETAYDRLYAKLEETRLAEARKEVERIETFAAATVRVEAEIAERRERARTTNFRTAKDDERTERAAETVARMREAFGAAQRAVQAAEDACVEDPSAAGAFEKAREARRASDEAARDLELAQAHATKVEKEIAAAEKIAIERAIEERWASLTEIVDDEALDGAVALAVAALQGMQRHEARVAQFRAELAELKAFRERIGDHPTPQEEAAQEATIRISFQRLRDVALSAQAQLLRQTGRSRDEAGGTEWPMWRGEAVLSGIESYNVSGSTGDGEPITMGVDRRPLVREAASVLERVRAREPGASPAGGKGRAKAGGAVKAVAAVGAVVGAVAGAIAAVHG